MSGKNVLSLFDGMSCGRLALEESEVEVKSYYASELDKYAIKVTQANWPKTIQLGDVTKWRDWDIDWSSIDLLIGGSPCQGFSFAGKQLAFDDPRSALFFEYLNILNHIKSVNPNIKFMLENVKMKKEYLDVISSMLKVEPVFINSSLVSAQSRQRYYWANWEFSEPEDKGLLLKDIIDYDVELSLSDKEMSYMTSDSGKGFNGGKTRLESRCRGEGQKSNTISHSQHKGVPYGVISINETANSTGKSYALTSSYSAGSNASYSAKGKQRTLAPVCADSTSHGMNYNGVKYRKLTPVECERLQTVPDNYTNHVSKTQRYKMLGNGWTVLVVAHIFMGLK